MEYRTAGFNDVNILLLGDKGVGKTTFITAFVNCFKFESFNNIIDNGLDYIAGKNQDETSIYGIKSYSFLQRNRRLYRMIDTPGFECTDNSTNNAKILEHILLNVRQYDKINAICFLIDANSSTINPFYKIAINHVHKMLYTTKSSPWGSIFFLFTKSKNVFYKNNELLGQLRSLLTDSNETPNFASFFIDNEFIKYLLDVDGNVNKEIIENMGFEASWRRLLQVCFDISRLVGLNRGDVSNVLPKNKAKALIYEAYQPLIDIFELIDYNIKLLQDLEVRILADDIATEDLQECCFTPSVWLKFTMLPEPVTVCTSTKCIENFRTASGWKRYRNKTCFKTDMFSNDQTLFFKTLGVGTICKQCGCDFAEHKQMYYDAEYITSKQMDSETMLVSAEDVIRFKYVKIRELHDVKLDYQQEKEIIINKLVELNQYLSANALYNVEYVFSSYLDILLTRNTDNSYKALQESMNPSDANYERSEKDIFDIFEALHKLEKTGKRIKQLHNIQSRWQLVRKERVYLGIIKNIIPNDWNLDGDDCVAVTEVPKLNRAIDMNKQVVDSSIHNKTPRANPINQRKINIKANNVHSKEVGDNGATTTSCRGRGGYQNSRGTRANWRANQRFVKNYKTNNHAQVANDGPEDYVVAKISSSLKNTNNLHEIVNSTSSSNKKKNVKQPIMDVTKLNDEQIGKIIESGNLNLAFQAMKQHRLQTAKAEEAAPRREVASKPESSVPSKCDVAPNVCKQNTKEDNIQKFIEMGDLSKAFEAMRAQKKKELIQTKPKQFRDESSDNESSDSDDGDSGIQNFVIIEKESLKGFNETSVSNVSHGIQSIQNMKTTPTTTNIQSSNIKTSNVSYTSQTDNENVKSPSMSRETGAGTGNVQIPPQSIPRAPFQNSANAYVQIPPQSIPRAPFQNSANAYVQIPPQSIPRAPFQNSANAYVQIPSMSRETGAGTGNVQIPPQSIPRAPFQKSTNTNVQIPSMSRETGAGTENVQIPPQSIPRAPFQNSANTNVQIPSMSRETGAGTRNVRIPPQSIPRAPFQNSANTNVQIASASQGPGTSTGNVRISPQSIPIASFQNNLNTNFQNPSTSQGTRASTGNSHAIPMRYHDVYSNQERIPKKYQKESSSSCNLM